MLVSTTRDAHEGDEFLEHLGIQFSSVLTVEGVWVLSMQTSYARVQLGSAAAQQVTIWGAQCEYTN